MSFVIGHVLGQNNCIDNKFTKSNTVQTFNDLWFKSMVGFTKNMPLSQKKNGNGALYAILSILSKKIYKSMQDFQ